MSTGRTSSARSAAHAIAWSPNASWDALVPVMPILALAWIAAASVWSAQVVGLL
jgi:hypothetical protein